ncbi:hypothetical protein [Gilvimarinus gilvus]|uniref:hypothetical protein n=1 Tax=Gilvimarinus gilvus TaxID=3058038 RepID=UPI00351D1579
MDTWMGHQNDPVTLNKYLYANGDPILNVDPSGNFSIGSLGSSMSSALQLSVRVTYNVARSGGKKSVSMASHLMGRLAVNALRPIFRAVGRVEMKGKRGRKITSFDKMKRFFASPNKSHTGVTWGPIGRFLKRAFPNTKWEQHHVAIQKKWFRQGSPSQWYPRDPIANRGLQRLGNAGFNLMSIPRGLNNALGRSPAGTAGLAIGSYGTVAYAVHTILNSDDNDDAQ